MPMRKIRLHNPLVALSLLGIVLFFLVFSSKAAQPLKQDAHAKTIVWLQSQVGGLSLREGQENNSTLTFANVSLHETDFIFTELAEASKLTTAQELRVTPHQFNPFYNLVTIHAP